MKHLVTPLHSTHVTRRTMIQAGTIGMMGIGLPHLLALDAAKTGSPTAPKKSVIFVFLNGGLSHQDSFDLKPYAPATVRSEFQPISTSVTGTQICEHLPMMAQRTHKYAMIRSVATESNGHGEACHMLFTGRFDFPPGFVDNGIPNPNEWPSFLSQVTYALKDDGGLLPPAAVLPQPSINEANNFRPGQYAGKMGNKWEAWHIDIAAPCALGNGACPNCFRFDEDHFQHGSPTVFNTPVLTLPAGGQ
ncbi:MAG: DUF1501 domain-containing protein, partial [Planctomycetaceae bacterium]